MVTVLLVEDEPIVAEIYQLALERAGYGVVIARDGAEALRLAGESAPDFMFLDIRLPKMGGLDVLRAKASDARTRDIPTVMMTNFDDPALIRSCRELGARDYLVKAGFNPSELGGIVARWVRPGVV